MRLVLIAICALTLRGDAPVVELKGTATQPSGNTNLLFRAEPSGVYKVLRTRESEALFADTNLLNRTLLVKGRIDPTNSTLQVAGNLHAIHDGKTFELYYYCDICSITTSYPGLCACCREPVVLMEREVKQ